jgi:hypothetical protein
LGKLDHKSLLRLWQEHEREWMRRRGEELDFLAHHGHWPERACKNSDCENREGSQAGSRYRSGQKDISKLKQPTTEDGFVFLRWKMKCL